jgi:ATP-dependent DNA ligase
MMELDNDFETAVVVPQENCSNIKFYEVCRVLDEIESNSTELSATVKLDKIFNNNLAASLVDHSTYPLVRLLIPYHDNSRGNFGIKEAKLIDIYINALSIPKEDSDYAKLINWKHPDNVNREDVGKLIYGVSGQRSSINKPSNKTLGDINMLLDRIVDANMASTEKDNKDSVFRDKIINVFPPTEQKWLIRIIFAKGDDKGLKIGLKKDSILNRLHPLAKEMHDSKCDLKGTLDGITPIGIAAASRKEDEGAITIEPLVAFSPMLSKKANTSVYHQSMSMIEATMDQIKEKPYIMETKIDGERMIFHKKGDETVLYSRKCTMYSTRYKHLEDTINKVMIANGVENCILDGEIVAWDTINNVAMPFGNNRSVAIVEGNGQASKDVLQYHVFDCLWFKAVEDCDVNGNNSNKNNNNNNNNNRTNARIKECIDDAMIKGHLPGYDKNANYQILEKFMNNTNKKSSVLMLPLAVRRILAERLCIVPVGIDRTRLFTTKSVVCTASDETERRRTLLGFFDAENSLGAEGIMVKLMDKPYILNQRSKSSWLKLKPDYSNAFTDMDVLVVGATYGDGRNQGTISSFVVAVINENGTFSAIGKVGSGYNAEQKEKFNHHIQKLQGDEAMVLWKKNTPFPEECLSWWGGDMSKQSTSGDSRPDILLPPCENSLVLTVKCAELVETDKYTSGICMRFPRMTTIRYDKPFKEVLSYKELIITMNQPKKDIDHSATAKVGINNRKSNRAKVTAISKVDPRFRARTEEDGPAVQFFDVMDNDNNDDDDDIPIEAVEGIFDGMVFVLPNDSYLKDTALAMKTKAEPEPEVEKVQAIEEKRPEQYKAFMVEYSAKAIAIFGDVVSIKNILDNHEFKYAEHLIDPIKKEKSVGYINRIMKKNTVLRDLGDDFPFLRLDGTLVPRNSNSNNSRQSTVQKREKVSSHSGITYLIKKGGGRCDQSYASTPDSGMEPLIVVGPKRPLAIATKNTIIFKDCTAISYKYILDCVRAKETLELTHEYIIMSSSNTYEEHLADACDIWGDSKTEDITPKRLETLLESCQYSCERFKKQVEDYKSANARSKKQIAAQAALGSTDLTKKKRSIVEDIAVNGTSKKWQRVGSKRFDDNSQEALRQATGIILWNPKIVVYFDFKTTSTTSKPITGACPAGANKVNLKLQYNKKDNSVFGYQGTDNARALHTVARLRARGMNIVQSFNAEVTHIILINGATECSEQLISIVKKFKRNVKYSNSNENTDNDNWKDIVSDTDSSCVMVFPMSWVEAQLQI